MYALSSRQSFKRTLSKKLSAGFTKAQLPDAEEPSRIVVIEKPSTKLGLQVGWNDGASAGLVVQLVTDDSSHAWPLATRAAPRAGWTARPRRAPMNRAA